MRNVLKWTLGILTLSAAILVLGPTDAEAHRYGYNRPRYYPSYPAHCNPNVRYSYYRPSYAPNYRSAYRPYYGRPYYGGYNYYGGPRFSIGIGF